MLCQATLSDALIAHDLYKQMLGSRSSRPNAVLITISFEASVHNLGWLVQAPDHLISCLSFTQMALAYPIKVDNELKVIKQPMMQRLMETVFRDF